VLRTNLRLSAIAKNSRDYNRLLHSSIPAHGIAALEFLPHWMRPLHSLTALVREKRGWEHVEAALTSGRPIIFMSPHLGALEMTGVCVAGLIPRKLAPLYRPPKQPYLEPLMIYSRSRGGAEPAPANAAGVRVLLKTLKQGGVAYLLPDQVPGGGEGVWAPFFGQPAYTMILLAKMARASNAIILPCYTERLGIGRGYRFNVQPFVGELTGEPEHDATVMNQNLEDLIRQIPEQYFWSYSRFKHPAGAPLPPSYPSEAA
jgi:KDO2-lipid IV(A) lauroyltransferase